MSKPASSSAKRLLIILVGVAILVVGVHLGGVALMRHYAEEFLHPPLPQGTRVGEIHLNLFTGALEVRDFELRNDEQLRIRFGLLTLKISPWQLLTGKVHVQNARLSDGYLRVDRRPDGSYDLGIPPMGGEDPAPAASEPPAVSIARAGIEGFDLEYHDGEFSALARVEQIEMGAYALRATKQDVPVDWRLSLDEREISGSASLSIGQDGLDADGQLTTAMLDLAGIQRLAGLDPVVKGEASFDGTFQWQAPRLVLHGSLKAPSIAAKVGDRLAKVANGSFPELHFTLTTAPDLVAEFAPAQGSQVERIEWTMPAQQASADRLRIAGKFHYEDDRLVNLSGLRFQAARLDWQSGTRQAGLSDLAIGGTLQQGIAGELHLPEADLNISAARVEYADTQAELTLGLDGLKLDGLKLSPAEGVGRNLKGHLNVAASRVGQADSVVQWSQLDASLGGIVGLTQARLSSDFAIDDLQLENPALVNGPLQVAKITTAGLVAGTESRFEQLQLSGVRLPGGLAETGVAISTLTLSNGSYTPTAGLDLGDIVIDGLQTAVIRDEKGQWQHPGTAISPPAPAADAGQGATPAQAGEGMAWRVGSLAVTGDSYVIAGDRTNPAATPQRNLIDVLSIGELASAKPDQDTPFEIRVHPDKYTSFQFKGVARPVADPVHLDAKGELQGLSMPRLNGYIANDLGHKFLAGQLDARFDVKIADNRLKMANSLELHGAEAEEIEGKEGPPLPTAIALLEDRDGYVKIDVPVEGRLDDPGFRVLAALNPVIMKAVAGTAALAIQPLGSVLLVGGLLADKALKVTFNPALFDPGSSDVNAEAAKYLGDLSGKLKEKPKLALRVCGVAVDAERQKDKKGAYLDKEEDMLALAQQRADAVRTFMQEKGTAKTQLRSCRPKLDKEPEAAPRVEIRL